MSTIRGRKFDSVLDLDVPDKIHIRGRKFDSELDKDSKGMKKVSYEKVLDVVDKIKKVLEIYHSEMGKIRASLYELRGAIEEISEKEGKYLAYKIYEFLDYLEHLLVDAIDDFAVKELNCDRDVEKYYVPSSEDHEICVVDTDKGLYGITTDLKDDVWLTRVGKE